MTSNERFSHLFTRYADKQCTPAEKEELFTLIRNGQFDHLLEQLVAERWIKPVPAWERVNDEQQGDAVFQAILDKVKTKRIFPFRKVAIAAALVLLIGAGGYIGWNTLFRNDTTSEQAVVTPDIPAGGNKATLTLADGKTILLDSVNNGTLASQGDAKIIKLEDGQLKYDFASSTTDRPRSTGYNTITTPRGGQYQVVLPDGTKVWLNAASSIHFPIAFDGNTRVVGITGEAYLEVAENKKLPFEVKVKDMTVTVLGTHFNIMAYDDEEAIKTTLVQGAVQVSQGNQARLLKPGQRALLSKQGTLSVEPAAVEMDIAWKNGLIQYNAASIQLIMRQVSRWYDVDIEYEGNLADKDFAFSIPRGANLRQLLKMLEMTGAVEFSVEGKKIIVKP